MHLKYSKGEYLEHLILNPSDRSNILRKAPDFDFPVPHICCWYLF